MTGYDGRDLSMPSRTKLAPMCATADSSSTKEGCFSEYSLDLARLAQYVRTEHRALPLNNVVQFFFCMHLPNVLLEIIETRPHLLLVPTVLPGAFI